MTSFLGSGEFSFWYDFKLKENPQEYFKELGIMAHICNPSYLGDGDQKNCGLRQA
jgi:hypothetical protein